MLSIHQFISENGDNNYLRSRVLGLYEKMNFGFSVHIPLIIDNTVKL